MAVMTCAAALADGIAEAMRSNDQVIVIGSPAFVGAAPGDSGVHFAQLSRQFPDRFVPTPTSELCLCGMGAGAAMMGLRPLVSIPTGSFAFEGFAAIVNEAAVAHYMSNGLTEAPVTFHFSDGIRGAGGAQHSHSLHTLLNQIPGLQILMPSSPQDFRDLIRYALLHSRNPTAFVNHFRLFEVSGEVGERPAPRRLPPPAVKRSGNDVTIVALGIMTYRALQAASRLEGNGISTEVIDLPSLVPLDTEAIARSVRRTRRLVVADEGHLTCGAAGSIVADLLESAFDSLAVAPRRVTIPDVHIPYSPALEEAVTPTTQAITAAVQAIVSDP